MRHLSNLVKMNKLLVGSLLVILIAWYYLQSGKQSQKGRVVKTKSGSVQGIISVSRDGRDFEEWLGIPYAEPPVGDLLFTSPKLVRPWNGVRDGSKYGSTCAQVLSLGGWSFNLGSEECLYLNVHVPKLEQSTRKLPVMVWIHGGAFATGSSSEYRPEYFMDEDVVVVTVNYRLGSFGFLSTGDTVIRGNMGLKDQALAIKWVRDNIETFGGDARRITIFGESAGGASVHYQTLSRMTKGLFQKAIAQSGNAAAPWAVHTAEEARKMTSKFAQSVGCNHADSAQVANCLKSKTVAELLEGSKYDMENFYAMKPHKDGEHFRPCIEAVDDDEAFITEHPLDIVISGKAHRLPLMTGSLADEGLFSTMVLLKNEDNLVSFETNWTANMGRAFDIPPRSKKLNEITHKLREYYVPNWEKLSSEDRIAAYTKMFTDNYFNFHMHHVIAQQREFSPVFAYHYSRRGGPSFAALLGEAAGNWPVLNAVSVIAKNLVFPYVLGIKPWDYGVCHADELPMLFITTITAALPKNDQDPDYLFSKELVKLWVNFASDEDTVQFRGVAFRPTSKNGSVQYFEITDGHPGIINAPFENRVEFLKTLNLLNTKSL